MLERKKITAQLSLVAFFLLAVGLSLILSTKPDSVNAMFDQSIFLSVLISPVGTFDAKTGAATIDGVVECTPPLVINQTTLDLSLRQKLGRKTTISGETSLGLGQCDGVIPWSATILADEGSFGGGHALATGHAGGSSNLGDVSAFTSPIVKLKGGPKK